MFIFLFFYFYGFFLPRFQSPTGGRITVMQSTLPVSGPHPLQVRDDAASRGTPKVRQQMIRVWVFVVEIYGR